MSYQLLKYLVILMVFVFFSQAISTTLVKSLMVRSRLVISDIKEVLMFLNDNVRSNKYYFLFTVFNYKLFTSVNMFFYNGNGNCERCIIRRQPPVRMNQIVIQFTCTVSKKHEINDQVWVMFVIWIPHWNLVSRVWQF